MAFDKVLFCKELLEDVCIANPTILLSVLPKILKSFGYTDVEVNHNRNKSYIYAKGDEPYMMIAHLDTVHKYSVKKIVWKKNKLSSPQGIGGDDRCGVFLILSMLAKGLRPSILFPCGEEIGGLGTSEFISKHKELPNVNFFLEIDRRGVNDVVTYSDESELYKYFEKYSFKKAYGSFTDISLLMPAYEIAGVNISSAYYMAHTTMEYIVFEELKILFGRLELLLHDKDLINTFHPYRRRVVTIDSSWYKRWRESFDNDDDYFSSKPLSSYQESKKNDSNSTLLDKKFTCLLCQNKFTFSEVEDTDVGIICSDCVSKELYKGSMKRCECCHKCFFVEGNTYSAQFEDINSMDYDPDTDVYICPFCGSESYEF